jgi:hypothetical protein
MAAVDTQVARSVRRALTAAPVAFDVRHRVETIHARRTRPASYREPDPQAGADCRPAMINPAYELLG